MSHLLDTDICSSIIRDVRAVKHHYGQQTGRMHLSVVSITELELWLLRSRTPLRYRQKFFNLQHALQLVDVTEPIAHRAAMIAHALKHQGTPIGLGDALIAATAKELGLILMTRKVRPFVNVPGLTVIDWSIP